MPTPGAQNDADKKAAKAATSQGRHNREVIAHGYAFVTLKKDFVRSLLATRALPLPTAQAGCCWVLPGWGRGAGWALLERGRALAKLGAVRAGQGAGRCSSAAAHLPRVAVAAHREATAT